MRKLLLTKLLTLLAAGPLCVTSALGQTTVDFEGLAVDELVTNQYAADGVTFENAFASIARVSLNEIDFPPTSGQTAASGFSDSSILIHVDPPMPVVSMNLTAANVATVSAFDGLGGLLDSVEVGPNLGGSTNVEFVAGELIGRVEVVGQVGARFLTIDDVATSPDLPPPPRCDVDADSDIDRLDTSLIIAARNQPADGPDDPRDANGDGVITVVDARTCVAQCTLPRCAVTP